MPKRSAATMRMVRRPTGRHGTSRPMRPAIRGKTGPRPSRIICTSPTRWRWCMRSTSRLAGSIRCSRTSWRGATPQQDRCRPGRRPPHRPNRFEAILDRWLVLSEASNSINRCMGLPDLYPFVISPAAEGKLGFVHELIGAKGGSRASRASAPVTEQVSAAASHLRHAQRASKSVTSGHKRSCRRLDCREQCSATVVWPTSQRARKEHCPCENCSPFRPRRRP